MYKENHDQIVNLHTHKNKANDRITRLEDRMNEVDNKLIMLGDQPSGEGGPDISAIERMLNQLRKEFKDKFL